MGLEVDQILTQVNRMLVDDLGDGRMLRNAHARVQDLGTRSLVYAGAGHIPGDALSTPLAQWNIPWRATHNPSPPEFETFASSFHHTLRGNFWSYSQTGSQKRYRQTAKNGELVAHSTNLITYRNRPANQLGRRLRP
jgi:hypothetical protein